VLEEDKWKMNLNEARRLKPERGIPGSRESKQEN